MSAKRTVYVVDDAENARRSLRVLLEATGYIVRDYSSAAEFLAEEDKSGDCVVADFRMPGMDGLELQQEIVARGIGLPVIIITGSGDIPGAVKAIKAGAIDFIEKPFRGEVLLDTLERAIELGERDRQRAAEAGEANRRVSTLTPRERDVLAELALGRSNKSAARRLAISPRTVEVHRARIMKKLDAYSFTDLMRIAIAASLLPPPA